MLCLRYAQKYSPELGIYNDLRYVPFTSHVPFGKVVSATPNGPERSPRCPMVLPPPTVRTSTALRRCCSPTTCPRNYHYREQPARMLNIKFTPKCLAGDAGTPSWSPSIRTFCDLKLWHVQFNVVNRETLLAAQENPEKYRNLIVRVAGYTRLLRGLVPRPAE